MRSNRTRVGAVVGVIGLVCTAALVVATPFVDDRLIKGTDAQWDVRCASAGVSNQIETTVSTRNGLAYLSIEGTVTYSAERSLAIHTMEHRDGEALVFIAPTDELMAAHSDLECDRVQSTIDVTVRLDEDYRTIQVVSAGEIAGEHYTRKETVVGDTPLIRGLADL